MTRTAERNSKITCLNGRLRTVETLEVSLGILRKLPIIKDFSTVLMLSLNFSWRRSRERKKKHNTNYSITWVESKSILFENKKAGIPAFCFFRNTCDSPIDLIFLNKYTVHMHLPVSVFHSESEVNDRLHGICNNLSLQSTLLFVAWNNSCLPS